jgi:hypothetical protein
MNTRIASLAYMPQRLEKCAASTPLQNRLSSPYTVKPVSTMIVTAAPDPIADGHDL